MTGACDLFLPPPSFCASIMACLFCSASSNGFFCFPLSLFLPNSLLLFLLLLGQFLLLLCSDFLPLGLFVLQPFELLLLLLPLFSPLIDVLFQLIVQFTLIGTSFCSGKGFISLFGGLRGSLVLVVGHSVAFQSINPPR